MRNFKATQGAVLHLGRRGENDVTRLEFDIAPYRETFGEGTVCLLAQRRGDENPYPVAVTAEGDSVFWTVSSADTAKEGIGRCELQYVVGTAIAKSDIWRTFTSLSLDEPDEEAPEACAAWVAQVLEAAASAQSVLQALQAALAAAPYIGENGNWFVWDDELSRCADSGIPAAGQRGESGLLPLETADCAASLILKANVKTVISELDSDISISLGAPVEGYDNEWDAVISQGATAYDVTLPAVSWSYGAAPAFDAGSVTEIRLSYVGDTLCGEWITV